MKKSPTLIERAISSILKVNELYSKLQRHIEITGKSKSNTSKETIIPILQDELGKINLPERLSIKYHICPACKTGELITIMTFKGEGILLQRLRYRLWYGIF